MYFHKRFSTIFLYWTELYTKHWVEKKQTLTHQICDIILQQISLPKTSTILYTRKHKHMTNKSNALQSRLISEFLWSSNVAHTNITTTEATTANYYHLLVFDVNGKPNFLFLYTNIYPIFVSHHNQVQRIYSMYLISGLLLWSSSHTNTHTILYRIHVGRFSFNKYFYKTNAELYETTNCNYVHGFIGNALDLNDAWLTLDWLSSIE